MNLTEKLAAFFIAVVFTLILYFNADNEKRLEYQIEDGISIEVQVK
jgi:hypothetical protein